MDRLAHRAHPRHIPARRLLRAVPRRACSRAFHTIAGLVFDRLGRMPKVGDQVRINGVRLRMLAIKGLRISMLEAAFPRPPTVHAPDHTP